MDNINYNEIYKYGLYNNNYQLVLESIDHIKSDFLEKINNEYFSNENENYKKWVKKFNVTKDELLKKYNCNFNFLDDSDLSKSLKDLKNCLLYKYSVNNINEMLIEINNNISKVDLINLIITITRNENLPIILWRLKKYFIEFKVKNNNERIINDILSGKEIEKKEFNKESKEFINKVKELIKNKNTEKKIINLVDKSEDNYSTMISNFKKINNDKIFNTETAYNKDENREDSHKRTHKIFNSKNDYKKMSNSIKKNPNNIIPTVKDINNSVSVENLINIMHSTNKNKAEDFNNINNINNINNGVHLSKEDKNKFECIKKGNKLNSVNNNFKKKLLEDLVQNNNKKFLFNFPKEECTYLSCD
jgi:hypothetical protein